MYFRFFIDFFRNILGVRFICMADKANVQQENVDKPNALATFAADNLFESISIISASQKQNLRLLFLVYKF